MKKASCLDLSLLVTLNLSSRQICRQTISQNSATVIIARTSRRKQLIFFVLLSPGQYAGQRRQTISSLSPCGRTSSGYLAPNDSNQARQTDGRADYRSPYQRRIAWLLRGRWANRSINNDRSGVWRAGMQEGGAEIGYRGGLANRRCWRDLW